MPKLVTKKLFNVTKLRKASFHHEKTLAPRKEYHQWTRHCKLNYEGHRKSSQSTVSLKQWTQVNAIRFSSKKEMHYRSIITLLYIIPKEACLYQNVHARVIRNHSKSKAIAYRNLNI